MAKSKKSEIDVLESNAKEMLGEMSDKTELPARLKEKHEQGTKLMTYLANKKRIFKQTRYRRKYDSILEYCSQNLVNTETYQTAMKSQATNIAYSFVYENGSYTQVPVLARNNSNDNTLRIPLAKEPVAFSKIMTAVSVLAGNVPDGDFYASDKIYARTQYELWKRTWTNPLGNGLNTIQNLYQNVLTTGVGAYRVFPRKIIQNHKGQERILFEDIYRQALDMRRTWLGNSINIYDRWSYGEVLYEIDQEAKRFVEKYPDSKYFQLEYASSVQESQIDESVSMDFVTIRYYEDPLSNKYCVACGNFPIYEGEMPSDEGFGHVVWANCFIKEPNDPYGVGIVEIIRGNTELYDYIERLSAEQVEAEISPLLFGTNTGVGEMTYKRGPNVINPKTAGTAIDIIKTSGNVQQSLIFADKQKQIISENTGINDILAGQGGEGTLGATVILKEAALNRLVIPRNNVVSALEMDAYMTLAWIKQTYTVEKIMEFTSEAEVQQFLKNNPTYYLSFQDIKYKKMDKEALESEVMPESKVDKYVYGVSKRVSLNFNIKGSDDGNPQNDLIEELGDDYTIPAPHLFKELADRGHLSDKIEVVLDGTSMLLPSEEINKQRMTEIYTLVTQGLVQIMQAMQPLPALARSLMSSLERMLEVNKESVFDWIPKDIYDQVMTPPQPPQQQPSAADIANGHPPGTNPNSPDAMAGAQQIQPGAQPGQGMPPMPQMQSTPGTMQNPTGPMTQKFKSGFNKEIVNPMKGAMNASIGRAAKSRTTSLTSKK